MSIIETLREILAVISFADFIGIVGYITTGLIVLAVSIRSIIDVLKATGIFYQKWMDFVYRNEDEKIKRALEHVGILSRVNHYKGLTLALNAGFARMGNDEMKREFRSIAQRFIVKESLVVGDTSEQNIEYYLNLRKAFCTNYAREIVEITCSFILNTSISQGIEFDCIVSRKSGMDLLGFHVASVLEVPFVLFHDQKSILKNNRIRAFDYLPDGIAKPIIVDDSCVGGTSIAELAVQFKRDAGIEIKHAFVLFTRKLESKIKVEQSGVFLHYIEFFDDHRLRKLLKKKPEALEEKDPNTDVDEKMEGQDDSK